MNNKKHSIHCDGAHPFVAVAKFIDEDENEFSLGFTISHSESKGRKEGLSIKTGQGDFVQIDFLTLACVDMIDEYSRPYELTGDDREYAKMTLKRFARSGGKFSLDLFKNGQRISMNRDFYSGLVSKIYKGL